MAAASGGSIPVGFLDKLRLTWLPEVFFAAGFGYAAYQYGGWIAAVMATAWSYLWMQTGHGTVLAWGKPQHISEISRVQTLTPFVDALADKLGINKTIGNPEEGIGHSINYCRLLMAVKGFLIGLPVGGILLAVLWPLAYEIGVRVKNHTVSELLSGTFAGISISIFMALTK